MSATAESFVPCSEVPPVAEERRPRLHQSMAHILISQSPLHARHRMDHQTTPTDAMERGSIIDRMLFGSGQELLIVEADDWRKKASQEMREEARATNRLPILARVHAGYETAIKAIRANLAALGIQFTGQSQVSLEWTSPLGVDCAGRLDHLILGRHSATIYDLKTTTDAHPDAIQRSLVDHGADIQRAAYTEAVGTLYPQFAGRTDMRFLYVEWEEPYAITVVECAGTMKALGEFKWEKAQRIWKECIETNTWPGYGFARIEAKPWQLTEAMEEEDVIHIK